MKIDDKGILLYGDQEVKKIIFQPYDDLIIEFLDELYKEIWQKKVSKQYPDLITLAFWCRKSNILKKKEEFNNGNNKRLRLGRGIVFHISPSNVPINFAYSFIFGLLSGNSNIIRVPSKDFPQTGVFISCLKQVLDDERYSEIKKANKFIKYSRTQEDLTRFFSNLADIRVIWGGNKTIREIKRISQPDYLKEITFPDRYSFCIINAEVLENIKEDELNKLVERFYNDTYLMDQNACSSPHLVVWYGLRDKEIKNSFWRSLYNIVKKNYHFEPIYAIDKYVKFCEDAINLNNIKSYKTVSNYVNIISISKILETNDELRGRLGYFYEYNIENLDELAKIINKSYQSLTYYGFNKDQLEKFVIDNKLEGIDRIVPIGQALEINVIWDGIDIIDHMSRIIDIRN